MNRFIGKTLISVVNKDNEGLIFAATDGIVFRMYHEQDCCESVYIESIVGDLNDLIGTPILAAEASTSTDKYPPGTVEAITARIVGEEAEAESQTWTFYKLATNKGYVDIRWYGSSNGYYSESVDLGGNNTMKIKISEATNTQLDWLVAKCEGYSDYMNTRYLSEHRFSTDWAQGGPILEREDICVWDKLDHGAWQARLARPKPLGGAVKYFNKGGPTPLIAAMRCYVASKLGDEVEIPEGLL